ncbi:MAG: hypothetical protein PHT58_01605, partial [Eubacteriales bacterium]|nr:hypothetical protein [Eubacteriales bacterium]
SFCRPAACLSCSRPLIFPPLHYTTLTQKSPVILDFFDSLRRPSGLLFDAIFFKQNFFAEIFDSVFFLSKLATL